MNYSAAIPTPTPITAAELESAILRRLTYDVGKDPAHAVADDWCKALSLVVRDRLVDPWMASTRGTYQSDAKRVYYLSMEFLVGRLLADALSATGMENQARTALERQGQDFDAILASEADAALGNGGLGRLAACFLESMSRLGIAGYGYGIRYEHGLFRQKFRDGYQVEEPEDWLDTGHVWEFERPEVVYDISFGGHVDHDGADGPKWQAGETVLAKAYDTPIAGWDGRHVNTLRLWAAKASETFNLDRFNRGEYVGALEQSALAETITRVLYPNDSTEQGKELRLKQEYFFTSASLQDLIRRYLSGHDDLAKLADHIAIQLNDTHPAIAVPELMRILSDIHGMALTRALEITRGCINYTNHTLLPEALERWPSDLLSRLLPRHLELIHWIDNHHRHEVANSPEPISPDAVAIVDPGSADILMGRLAFVGSSRVNGVSALHTELMKQTVFGDLHCLHPHRIVNQTNGITPRRWLYGCNRPLRSLLMETIGEKWIGDLSHIRELAAHGEDAAFCKAFGAAKRENKVRLAHDVANALGVNVDPDALFDVHIKRIHEYKRQTLNIIETIAHYFAILREPERDWTPRVKIFAGKAAPSYTMAKSIIQLINDVAQRVNSDPIVGDRLKIAFLPNYNVSLAEKIIPAADLSEQISTAGMEASGTGNMKLSLNGALTIGTLDGANVEIREHVGDQNIYIFGLVAKDVSALRSHGFNPRDPIDADPRLAEALEAIAAGEFSATDRDRYRGLADAIYHHDYFMVARDFSAYFEAQRTIDEDFKNTAEWQRRAVANTAQMGWFSSDRTIRGYAQDIWRVAIPGDRELTG